MSNFSKVRRVVLLCARCNARRPSGLLGDGAHTVPPRAANVFHRLGGPRMGGPPSFRSLTEQKDKLASAPSPGQSVVSVLIRHFGAVCLCDGSAAAGCARCAKLG